MRSGERQTRGVGDGTASQPSPRRSAVINKISRQMSFLLGSEAGKGRHSPRPFERRLQVRPSFGVTAPAGAAKCLQIFNLCGPCRHSLEFRVRQAGQNAPGTKSPGMVNGRRVPLSGERKGPARWRGSWTSSSSCQLPVLALQGLGIENDVAPDLVPALG